MNRRNILLIGLAAILLLASGVYYAVLREPEAPSAPIAAVPLDEAPQPTTEPEPTNTPEPEPTAAPTNTPEPIEEVEEVEEVEEEPTETPTEAPTEEPTPEPVVAEAMSEPVTFEIDTEQSTARFELDEDLHGSRITVVGTANQVAAQLRFDPADLSSTQIGTVLINARTFVTDNDFRNRAINNRILLTEQFEFVTFEPTALNGLPDSAAPGELVEFSIVGNLTVRDVTQEVTFDAAVSFDSAETVSGSAATIINYADFGIIIPDAPAIANVEDELELYIDFVATAVDG